MTFDTRFFIKAHAQALLNAFTGYDCEVAVDLSRIYLIPRRPGDIPLAVGFVETEHSRFETGGMTLLVDGHEDALLVLHDIVLDRFVREMRDGRLVTRRLK